MDRIGTWREPITPGQGGFHRKKKKKEGSQPEKEGDGGRSGVMVKAESASSVFLSFEGHSGDGPLGGWRTLWVKGSKKTKRTKE